MANERYGGFAQETTHDTAVAPTTFVDFVDINFNSERENLYEESVTNKSFVRQQEGVKRSNGNIQIFGDPHEMSSLFKFFYGQVTTLAAGDANAWRHTFTPADDILSFTFEKGNFMQGNSGSRFSGCFITRVTIEAIARQFLTVTYDLNGSGRETIVASNAAPTFSQIKSFWAGQGAVTINGVTHDRIESMRITQEHNVDLDAYAIGDEFLPAVEEEEFRTSLEMELAFVNANEHKRFLDGTTTSLAFAAQTSANIILTFTGDSTGSASSGFENHKLEITLPKVHYDASELPMRRRDRIIQRIRATGIYDSASGYENQIRIWNKQSAL